MVDNSLKPMSPQELRNYIKKLKVLAPITEEFTQEMQKRGNWQPETQWYNSQKQHWLGWLREYHTEGYYGRDTSKVRTAEFSYNHIACPPMVLWLGEAAGVDSSKILAAKDAALNCRPVFHSQCAAIRKEIPWKLIEEALKVYGVVESSRALCETAPEVDGEKKERTFARHRISLKKEKIPSSREYFEALSKL